MSSRRGSLPSSHAGDGDRDSDGNGDGDGDGNGNGNGNQWMDVLVLVRSSRLENGTDGGTVLCVYCTLCGYMQTKLVPSFLFPGCFLLLSFFISLLPFAMEGRLVIYLLVACTAPFLAILARSASVPAIPTNCTQLPAVLAGYSAGLLSPSRGFDTPAKRWLPWRCCWMAHCFGPECLEAEAVGRD